MRSGAISRSKSESEQWKSCGDDFTEDMKEFDKDFSEFVALLERHDVRYMIVGGYALAAHRRPQDLADVHRLTDETR